MFRSKSEPPSPAPPPPAAPVPAPSIATARPPAPAEDHGKRLIVGQGLSLSGEITACDLLVIEGNVQVTLNQTKAIEIAESGKFTNGKAEVDQAVISGLYEGELTVRGRLTIRSTGKVSGTIRYGEIEVERGGRLSGSVSMLESGSAQAAKPFTAPTAAATPAATAAKMPEKAPA